MNPIGYASTDFHGFLPGFVPIRQVRLFRTPRLRRGGGLRPRDDTKGHGWIHLN